MLRPYRHVLQRGDRRASTPLPQHVPWTPVFISLHCLCVNSVVLFLVSHANVNLEVYLSWVVILPWCGGEHLSLYVNVIVCYIYIYTVCLYSYHGSSSYMMYLQSVCILPVNRAVQEAAGLSAQWPFTSVMLVMPFFPFLSARQ